MSWLQEFKEFALKGNVVDLAIGVIIGAAFGKVVSSLVSDIMMPPIGMIVGAIDFSQLSVKMHIPGSSAEPVEVKYGLFLNNVISLMIIAWATFIVVKLMNQLKRKEENKEPLAKDCPECSMSIPFKAKKCPHCCSSLIRSDNTPLS